MTQFAILESKAIFAVVGPEAEKFLQGQLSCDVSKLTTGESCFGVFCSPQGRMHGNFIIFRKDDDCYLLQLEKSILESFTKQLGKYIVFSKAEINLFESCTIIQLLDSTQHNALTSLCDNQWAHPIITPDGELQVWSSEALDSSVLLESGLKQVPESMVSNVEIERGQAWITAATAGEYLPQMLNLDYRGAISFDKGCYTGQEVVARAHYRGQVKRRLYFGSVNEYEQQYMPELNSPLTNTEGKEVGNIINAVIDRSVLKILFVLNKEDYLDQEIHLQSKQSESVIQPRQLTKPEAG